MSTRIYDLINPSDAITFRATPEQAAFIADRMLAGMYFVKDAESGETPTLPDIKAAYDAMWRDAEKIASYAAAYRSFLIGSRNERQLFEDATAAMTPQQLVDYREKYHNRRRSSMNDICRNCWETAEKIAAYKPESVE